MVDIVVNCFMTLLQATQRCSFIFSLPLVHYLNYHQNIIIFIVARNIIAAHKIVRVTKISFEHAMMQNMCVGGGFCK
jgi:hypothetical protein